MAYYNRPLLQGNSLALTKRIFPSSGRNNGTMKLSRHRIIVPSDRFFPRKDRILPIPWREVTGPIPLSSKITTGPSRRIKSRQSIVTLSILEVQGYNSRLYV